MKANDTWTLNTGILQSNIVRNTFVNLFVYILLHIEQKKDLCRCLLPKKSILKYKIKRIYMRKKAVGAKWLTIYALVEKWSISGYCKINIHSCLNPRIYKINLTRHRCGRDHCDWKWLREMNVSLGRRQIGAIRSRLWRMNLPNATVLATFVADFLSYLTRNWGTVVFPPATRSVVSGGYDCAVRELSCVWQCSRDLRERLRNVRNVNTTRKNKMNPPSECEGFIRITKTNLVREKLRQALLGEGINATS